MIVANLIETSPKPEQWLHRRIYVVADGKGVLGSWPRPAGGSLHGFVLPSISQDMAEINVEQT